MINPVVGLTYSWNGKKVKVTFIFKTVEGPMCHIIFPEEGWASRQNVLASELGSIDEL